MFSCNHISNLLEEQERLKNYIFFFIFIKATKATIHESERQFKQLQKNIV